MNRTAPNLPFLVLDLSLDIIDGVRGLDLEGDGLSSESLNEDLHGCERCVVIGEGDKLGNEGTATEASLIYEDSIGV